MNLLGWLIVGLAAGAVARLVVPGRDSLGILATIALGLIGSVIGGFLASVFFEGEGNFEPAGLLGSIIGAVIALLVYQGITRPRRRHVL